MYVRYGIAEQQGTSVGTRVYLRVHEAGKGLVWRVLWPVRYHQRGTSRGTGSVMAYNLLARPYAQCNITIRRPRWAVCVGSVSWS